MDQHASPQQPQTQPRERKRLPILGLILVVIGIVLFLENLGYTWLNNIWFPLVLIILGVWVIARRSK